MTLITAEVRVVPADFYHYTRALDKQDLPWSLIGLGSRADNVIELQELTHA